MGNDGRSSTAKGYGADHRAARDYWQAIVEAGRATCANPQCSDPGGRTIRPGEPWDLGHTADRSGYRGPEHQACNRAEGARVANKGRAAANRMTIRNWGDPA